MATVTTTHRGVRIGLTLAERVAGLLADVEIPYEQITRARVVEDALGEVRGLRAPGWAIPGRSKVGTWRGRDGRSLVCVRAGVPALVLDLTGHRYQRVLVGVEPAAGSSLVSEIETQRAAAQREG